MAYVELVPDGFYNPYLHKPNFGIQVFLEYIL